MIKMMIMDSIATSKKRATERKKLIQLYRETDEAKTEKREGKRERECVFVHVGVWECVCVERGGGRENIRRAQLENGLTPQKAQNREK